MENSQKFGPSLKFMMLDPVQRCESATIPVLVRVDHELNEKQRGQLAELGVRLRTEAGDVITLDLPQNALPTLAAMDWVVYLEGSRPLSPETESEEFYQEME